MDPLKEMLREVLQQELAPIAGKLDSLDQRMALMEDRLTSVEDRLSSVEDRLSSVEDRLSSVEDRMTSVEDRLSATEKEIGSIKNQLDRLERMQTDDIMTVLHIIDNKLTTRLDRHDHQLSVLNDRLFVVEADVRKLYQLKA